MTEAARQKRPEPHKRRRPARTPLVYTVEVVPGPSDPEVARKIVEWLRERVR